MFVDDALACRLVGGGQGLCGVLYNPIVYGKFFSLSQPMKRSLHDEKELILPLTESGDDRDEKSRILLLLALDDCRRM